MKSLNLLQHGLGAATAAVGLPAALSLPVQAQDNQPKYSAEIPPYITTPDEVETRIGTLRYRYGMPDKDTVKLVYNVLDFYRGIGAFMAGMSVTSVYAICDGMAEAGIELNKGIGITEDLMDARSLFLTPNTTRFMFLCART